MTLPPSPLRLSLDGAALIANWKALAAMSGRADCGAAIKADGYGLGAQSVALRLAQAGCKDYFVASWPEVAALGALPSGCALSVLHGVQAEDMAFATRSAARPVLNTPAQIALWRATGLPCDVMVDTGMNRLGVSVADVQGGLLDGLVIETLMSHLASADEESVQNETQRMAFAALNGRTGARRMSLANSAGIALGRSYHLDLTRPGLALYGGVPRPEMAAALQQVAYPQAQVVQRRRLEAGETLGYNATWRASEPCEIAILNIGYADGYWRGFSDTGSAGEGRFPVRGRVSMDLTAICVNAEPDIGEGDWVTLDFALPSAAEASGLSQYELLTGLGQRLERVWR